MAIWLTNHVDQNDVSWRMYPWNDLCKCYCWCSDPVGGTSWSLQSEDCHKSMFTETSEEDISESLAVKCLKWTYYAPIINPKDWVYIFPWLRSGNSIFFITPEHLLLRIWCIYPSLASHFCWAPLHLATCCIVYHWAKISLPHLILLLTHIFIMHIFLMYSIYLSKKYLFGGITH